jgi:hypothetical protein
LLHGRERLSLGEQALLPQAVGDFRNQLPAETGDVRECGEHPDRRRTECDDTHELDAVAGRTTQQKIFAERRDAGLRALHAADVLDEKLQRDVDETAVETAAAQPERQRYRRDFANGAGSERGRRAHYALR